MLRTRATPWRCLVLFLPAWALALAASAAKAADTVDWRLGLGGGSAHGRTDCVAGHACDAEGGQGQLHVDALIDEAWALRLAAFGARRFHGGDTSPAGTPFGGDFEVRGLALSGSYRWAFAPDWDLEGRAGLASVQTRFRYAAPFAGSVSHTSTQPLLGLALGWSPAPDWRLCLEWDVTRFEAYRTQGPLRLLGLAVETRF